MTDKLKAAFDGIHAEDSLKTATRQFLYDQIQKGTKPRRRAAFRKYAAALACAAMIILTGSFAYNVYITPSAYVDVDINPSVELTLNRFDRVICAYAYNEDGSDITKLISVRHKSYGEALVALMDALAGQGYLQNDGLVSVTLQTDDQVREDKLLTGIQTGIEAYMTGHHQTAQVDVFPVSGAVRSSSHEQGVSPAKYLAIQELIEVDPTASVEKCRNHSISEIKQLTQAHGNHHGNSGGVTGGQTDAGSTSQNGGSHKGNQGGNRHHGHGH